MQKTFRINDTTALITLVLVIYSKKKLIKPGFFRPIWKAGDFRHAGRELKIYWMAMPIQELIFQGWIPIINLA